MSHASGARCALGEANKRPVASLRRWGERQRAGDGWQSVDGGWFGRLFCATCTLLNIQLLQNLIGSECHRGPIARANTVTESVLLPATRSEGTTMPQSTQQSTRLAPLIRHSSPVPWIRAIAISLVLWSLIIWGVVVALS